MTVHISEKDGLIERMRNKAGYWVWVSHFIKGEKLGSMEKQFIQHGDGIVTITGNTRCTNADCPYIKYVGDCTGDVENCDYRQQRNDAFLHYTFDGI